jgi:hypothetical protein
LFSNLTSSPSCSVVGPVKLNSIEAIVAPGVGSVAGAVDAVTTNGVGPE